MSTQTIDSTQIIETGVGARLKALRKKLGMNQIEMAKHLQIHNTDLSMFESGRRHIGLTRARRFAQILNVSLDWLIEGEEDR